MAEEQQASGTEYNPEQQGLTTGGPPQNTGYSPQNPGHLPQNLANPPQNPGNLPQNLAHSPQNPGYPPQNLAYPSQNSEYPPSNSVCPPNHGYAPSPNYGDNQGYSPAYQAGNPLAAAVVPQTNPLHNDAPSNTVMPLIPLPEQSAMQARKDPEGSMQDLRTFDFSEISIKHSFVRKVYSILMLQLPITVGLIIAFRYNDWVFHNPLATAVPALVATFVIAVSMLFFPILRRESPTNCTFLILFTVSEGMILAFVSAASRTEMGLIAIGITAVVYFAVIIFACQTKWEFNLLSAPLFVAAIIFVVFGLIAIANVEDMVVLVCVTIFVLIISLILVIDLHLMLSGGREISISPEEYIFTALTLRIDIIFIFVHILRSIALSRMCRALSR